MGIYFSIGTVVYQIGRANIGSHHRFFPSSIYSTRLGVIIDLPLQPAIVLCHLDRPGASCRLSVLYSQQSNATCDSNEPRSKL
jgi:hypothetical protein